MSVVALENIIGQEGLFQGIGTITGREEGELIVEAEQGRFRAVKAAGCLLQPGEGDKVLFAGEPKGELYVLMVLERGAEAGAAQLAVEGDLELKVPGGKLSVETRDGAELTSPQGEGRVALGKLSLRAREGSLSFGALSYLGRTVKAELSELKAVAERLETFSERLTSRAKQAYRFIERIEVVRANRVDYRAEEVFRLGAKNSLIYGQNVVKVDAEQIHLG